MSQDDLYDMSDDDLEAAFKAAKAEQGNQPSEEEIEVPDVDPDLNAEKEFEQPDTDDLDAAKENDGTEQLGTEQDSGPDVGDKTDKSGTEGEEAGKDKPVVDADKNLAAVDAPAVRKFKANGKEYEISEKEMLEQFPKVFGQAMDYTKKTQAIAPWRKTIDAIEQAKLNHSDINLMIDALKGDKGALAEVLKRTSTDALDLTTGELPYTPKDYGRDSQTLDLKDVLDSLQSDAEFATTSRILNTDWDEASWNTLSADPELIKLLHVDVKSGTYEKVQRIADKIKLFDSGRQSDLAYYRQAGRQYFADVDATNAKLQAEAEATARKQAEAQTRIAQAKVQDAQRKAGAQAAQARKAAAPSGAAAINPGKINFADASDDEWQEWYNKIND